MNDAESFSAAARRAGQRSLLAEFWAFLRATKKYWLLPILIVGALMVALALLSSSAASPFIYTLF